MLIYLLVFVFLTLNSNFISLEQINFSSHKNDKSSLDHDFLNQMKKIFNIDIFVESGTYNGGTTEIASNIFKKVHTIELDKKMVREAVNKFRDNKNIYVYEGSSAEVFKTLLPKLEKDKNILFFLDAHYCGENTAVDKEGPDNADGITAIRKEIDAIKQSCIEDCVVIVDDIRGFGTRINNKEFVGCWAYPCVQDVCKNLLEVNNNFNFYLLGDMMLAYDQTKYQVEVSPTVKACTISRLFDGKNYSEDELMEAENVISKSSGQERDFLKKLCESMNVWNDPEFHHELWDGLLCLNENKCEEAKRHLNKVLDRNYNHPRITTYINRAS